MKLLRSFLAANLVLSLVLVSFLTVAISDTNAQSTDIALQRGYRTGYSDGYMEGYRDVINNASKNIEAHDEYAVANRAYNKEYGDIDNYRDGYQQGFENGYGAGFGKQSFDAAIPAGLAKRGVRNVAISASAPIIEPVAEIPPVVSNPQTVQPEEVTGGQETGVVTYQAQPADGIAGNASPMAEPPGTAKYPTVTTTKASYQYASPGNNDIIVIPAETELVVELLDSVNTQKSREGDTFKAKIVSPIEIAGAIIEGRVDKIRQPGRIKRRAELLLSFDRIILTQDRWSNFNAIVTEVLPLKGDNVKRVDDEGTMEGKRPYKGDLTKIGASTGTGMITGGLIGGPVGVAIGAGVGAAFGVGMVVVDRGKHINLVETQQLRIKSAYETQIR